MTNFIPAIFQNGSAALFDDTAWIPSVNIPSSVAPAAVLFNNSSKGYTLSGGVATESRVICDVHGAHFDIDSGVPLMGPADEGLELYDVRLEGDDVFVARAG